MPSRACPSRLRLVWIGLAVSLCTLGDAAWPGRAEGGVFPVPHAVAAGSQFPDDAELAGFGKTIVAAGEWAVVCAPDASLGSYERSGSAWIYRRSGSQWAVSQRLSNPDPANDAAFCSAAALYGNNLAIASGVGSSVRVPSVLIYELRGLSWILTTRLRADSQTGSDEFGQALAIHDASLAISDPGADVTPLDFYRQRGEVRLYGRFGSKWSLVQRLQAGSDNAYDGFGTVLSLADWRLFVGAPEGQVDGFRQAGVVYQFDRGERGHWLGRGTLTADSPTENGKFGQAIAQSLGTIVVGEPNARSTDASYHGRVHVFELGKSTVRSASVLVSETPLAGYFGQAVAIEANRLAAASYPPHDFIDFGVPLPRIEQIETFNRGSNWKRESLRPMDPFIDRSPQFALNGGELLYPLMASSAAFRCIAVDSVDGAEAESVQLLCPTVAPQGAPVGKQSPQVKEPRRPSSALDLPPNGNHGRH